MAGAKSRGSRPRLPPQRSTGERAEGLGSQPALHLLRCSVRRAALRNSKSKRDLAGAATNCRPLGAVKGGCETRAPGPVILLTGATLARTSGLNRILFEFVPFSGGRLPCCLSSRKFRCCNCRVVPLARNQPKRGALSGQCNEVRF